MQDRSAASVRALGAALLAAAVTAAGPARAEDLPRRLAAAAPQLPSVPAPDTRSASAASQREDLLDSLMAWAVKLSGLPAAPDRPAVIALPTALLSATVCPDDPRHCNGLVALYDTDKVQVLILDSISLDDPVGQSFVVHEFVHHLQHRSQGQVPASHCERVIATETAAYAVQNRFLALHADPLRVGDVMRRMHCPNADADPVVMPFGTRPRPLADAR